MARGVDHADPGLRYECHHSICCRRGSVRTGILLQRERPQRDQHALARSRASLSRVVWIEHTHRLADLLSGGPVVLLVSALASLAEKSLYQGLMLLPKCSERLPRLAYPSQMT